jgi:hypothetical protein
MFRPFLGFWENFLVSPSTHAASASGQKRFGIKMKSNGTKEHYTGTRMDTGFFCSFAFGTIRNNIGTLHNF